MKIDNKYSNASKILIYLYLSGEVRYEHIKKIIQNSGVLKTEINRLKKRGYIEKRKPEFGSSIYLTEDGIRYVEEKFDLYSANSPVGELRYSVVKKVRMTSRQLRGMNIIAFGNTQIEVAEKIPTLNEPRNESIYIDTFRLKKELGQEVKQARVNGVCITKDEVYKIYGVDGQFKMLKPIEQRFIDRLKNKKMDGNPAQRTINEIVLSSNEKTLKAIMSTTREKSDEKSSLYYINSKDTHKYYVPFKTSEFQLKIATSKENRNKILNALNSELNSDMKTNWFGVVDNQFYMNLIDLNMGNIKKVMECNKHSPERIVTIVCLEEQKEMLDQIFEKENSYILLDRKQVEDIIEK